MSRIRMAIRIATFVGNKLFQSDCHLALCVAFRRAEIGGQRQVRMSKGLLYDVDALVRLRRSVGIKS